MLFIASSVEHDYTNLYYFDFCVRTSLCLLSLHHNPAESTLPQSCVNTNWSFSVAVVLARAHSQFNLYRASSLKSTIQPSKTAIGNRSKWTANNACWKSSILLARYVPSTTPPPTLQDLCPFRYHMNN